MHSYLSFADNWDISFASVATPDQFNWGMILPNTSCWFVGLKMPPKLVSTSSRHHLSSDSPGKFSYWELMLMVSPQDKKGGVKSIAIRLGVGICLVFGDFDVIKVTKCETNAQANSHMSSKDCVSKTTGGGVTHAGTFTKLRHSLHAFYGQSEGRSKGVEQGSSTHVLSDRDCTRYLLVYLIMRH
ncbi:hypothetical protein BDR07DRAFT_1371010 [Suillus spraguei]|nr:hypothetical protein BDR07DRAFT_1371010 [Suillus spraguei]